MIWIKCFCRVMHKFSGIGDTAFCSAAFRQPEIAEFGGVALQNVKSFNAFAFQLRRRLTAQLAILSVCGLPVSHRGRDPRPEVASLRGFKALEAAILFDQEALLVAGSECAALPHWFCSTAWPEQ